MIFQFLALLGAHWIGDFVLQTHWQASNKSTNNDALAMHVAVYTGVLALSSPYIFWTPGPASLAAFVGLNSFLHFVTDYFTSRVSSRLFAKDWHNFFVVIGFDQLIHQVTLGATMLFVFGGAG